MKSRNNFKPNNSEVARKIVRQKFGRLLVLSICGIMLSSIVVFVVHRENRQVSQKHTAISESVLHSLAELIELPPAQLEQTDIALLNLMCAQQLPGAGEINISNQLATLDQWPNVFRLRRSGISTASGPIHRSFILQKLFSEC